MDFIVRPYRSGEEEYVADLHERLYSEEYGWGPEFVRYAIEIPRRFAGKERNGREELFIAEQNGSPEGSIMLCAADDPDVGQLRVFAVEKDCRRQGIGAALLRAAMEKAESAGYRRVMLWTADAVTDALRKYEALGFRVTETKENRTWRPDGEAVVEIKMEKELG